MLSTLLVLAVWRTRLTLEPSEWSSSPRVSRSSVVRAPNRYLGGHAIDSRRGIRYFLQSHAHKYYLFGFYNFGRDKWTSASKKYIIKMRIITSILISITSERKIARKLPYCIQIYFHKSTKKHSIVCLSKQLIRIFQTKRHVSHLDRWVNR